MGLARKQAILPETLRVVCIGYTLLAIAPSAAAQDTVRETVTVTAAAEPVDFDALARTVYVITGDQLARLPVASVTEALALIAPVDVRTRGAGGIQADFSIRGASFGQALVLVDGVRLNDAQTGHHNGDIPVPLEDILRIEVLTGPGSSLHGADALGGTINIVTRRERHGAQATVAAAAFGGADASGRYDWRRASIGGAFARSGGFMFDRDFRSATLTGRGRFGDGYTVSAAWLDRAFGANNFYGASPSKEWTSQALLSLVRERLVYGQWRAKWRATYRTHADRFLWNVERPGLLENRHRSHAATFSLHAERELSASSLLVIGGEAGGDAVRSSNLGDREYARGAAFAELRYHAGRRFLTPAVRVDEYSQFGRAVSPSLAGGFWLGQVKLRGAAGHAFRVPTFTELYYRDPNHQASDALRAERAWSVEGGADWLPGARWHVGVTSFVRFERDVIDWVRPAATERWRTANIRRVTTSGVELGMRRMLGQAAFADVQYSLLHSHAPELGLLSKYVLDVARHRVNGTFSAALPGAFSVGTRVGYTRRVDGREYALLDARVGRAFKRVEAFIEGRNLLDTDYQEILGVDMPGASARAGLRWGLR